MFLCLIIVLICLLPSSHSRLEHVIFLYGDSTYIIVEKPLNWIESEFICEGYKGILAKIIDRGISSALHKFLLTRKEYANGFWIGAESPSTATGFSWVDDTSVYQPNMKITGGTIGFIAPVETCLVFAKFNVSSPTFKPVDCNLHKPFICEKDNNRYSSGYLTTREWLNIGNRLYGIFYDKKTWKEALQQCQEHHDAHLADFTNTADINAIGKYLLMGRPSIKKLWIGGLYMNGNWRYLVDGRVIPNEMNNATRYPPWIPDRIIDHEVYPFWALIRQRVLAGCLTLDKHFHFHPRFLEAHCEKELSYLCVKNA